MNVLRIVTGRDITIWMPPHQHRGAIENQRGADDGQRQRQQRGADLRHA